MDLELRGRTAVVTGCSVGIGREIARVLAAEGVAALVVARRGELLKTLQDEIEGAGWPRPHALAIDLADRGSAARVRDEALARLGRVDILVNNAAMFASPATGSDRSTTTRSRSPSGGGSWPRTWTACTCARAPCGRPCADRATAGS